jgi:hypothetical protein
LAISQGEELTYELFDEFIPMLFQEFPFLFLMKQLQLFLDLFPFLSGERIKSENEKAG